ncbi:BREX system P-loop protein BrxC [Parageobacillus thermoglucosidasius]|uniref:BREX system P-loop protein BrxC n=1 Tax=Parageobacillus thermoglucosidasius TaxID=1426 RepID=UPI002E1C1A08|nr:BREX system P-loop protein BrxC [Parageobacillus thermoglucosidasius]MED4914831.1 BREX system P-loop protein BrxC [Parageobacillus thermoglucosidasius]MED4943655.1 BREX system P-loop protein BrxC [Parageobacillus thermoglucosidasius]MED4982614.1 BREX system P-loop protein BrxC [Parageobacillus thermoglucosidasius]
MIIRDMFQKPIDRDIKGVIKVGQDDESNVYQELDEYVVTNEILEHLGDFFEAYKKSIVGHTDKMGVWISGFFGSGKSHFLKILSYLLENRQVKGKKAISFFENKISDPMVLADMKQAGDITADIILFNIDSKSEADSKQQKDAIVKVFNKVFNEMQGFCGSIPWVADLERRLVKDGCYEAFKAEFEKISGNKWEDAREDFYYEEDAIVEALTRTTKMSEEAARNWYNNVEETYSLSVEKFAQRVREYIESKGPNHHVVFLVDEMGQYIGDNSQLMLNLQTVVEDLGVQCGGKCWVIVTSQQDIDSVTNVRGNDFSKIQGRFDTRLSLSSANVDEVIKKRILQKTDDAKKMLKQLYPKKYSFIKNLITFKDTPEMKTYTDEEEFADVYPFIPYQFNLLQKVFTGIRIHGASGKHLAEGERSLLSAFQESAIKYANEEVGVLVPFSAFYETIEAFLDASIRSVIIQAKQNSRLTDFDVEVLKLLFLIKYVKEMPGKLENIATLLVNHIDVDKLELLKKVEESLHRLIKETLIQKNGDEYVFLTNDEQDVNKEIKNIHIDSGEVIQKIGEIIFEEIYPDKKYKYSSRYNFGFNAIIDDRTIRPQIHQIGLKIITPYYDSTVELNQAELKMMSMRENNVIVKLPNDTTFLEEMEEILKIQSYLRINSGIAVSQVIEDIKARKSREVTERKERVKTLLIEALKNAEIYVNSQLLEIKEKNPVDRINDGFRVLIESLYNKLNYVKEFVDSPKELYDLLKEDTVQLSLTDEEENKLAIDEVRNYIKRNTQRNLPMTVKGITTYFTNQPYGWTELDIVAIIIKLFKAKEIKLQLNSDYLTTADRDLVNYLTKRDYVDRVVVKQREKPPEKHVANVKKLCRDLFGYTAVPSDEDGLMNRFKDLLKDEIARINALLVHYEKTEYPGKDILIEGKKFMEQLLEIKDTMAFFEKAYELKDDLLDYEKYSAEIKDFFKNQKDIFDNALHKLEIYEKNKTYVIDTEVNDTIEKIRKIVKSKSPYSMIHKLPELINSFVDRFTELLEAECQPIINVVKSDYQKVIDELNKYDFKDELFSKFKARFDDLLTRLEQVNNFYEAIAMKEESDRLKMRCFNEISAEQEKRKPKAIVNPPFSELTGGEQVISGGSPVTYKTKRTVNISIANLLRGAKTIESQEDIEQLLNEIRSKLESELKEDTIIKLV